MMPNYQKAEIVFVDLGTVPDQVKGHEQANPRPCLIISPINALELAIIVPFTSKPKSSLYSVVEVKKGKLPPAKADYSLMNQVVMNLISNGIKYSSKKEKPVVEISSEEKDSETIFTVKDNGAGFNMQYADKLFGVFQRLHSQEEFQGTGVGLAIVQRIVSRHGGKVWADAKPDEGASFYFSIPKTQNDG